MKAMRTAPKAIIPTLIAMPTAAPALNPLLVKALLLLIMPVLSLPALAAGVGLGEGVGMLLINVVEVRDSIAEEIVVADVDNEDGATVTVSVETEETSAVVVCVTVLASGGVELVDVNTSDCTVDSGSLDADDAAVELTAEKKN